MELALVCNADLSDPTESGALAALMLDATQRELEIAIDLTATCAETIDPDDLPF